MADDDQTCRRARPVPSPVVVSARLESMRAPWDRRSALAVAVGGAAGAGLRWAVLTSVEPGRFPWPVLVINIAGSVLLGVLLAEESKHPARRLLVHDGGAIGFCGGLTTFSTLPLRS